MCEILTMIKTDNSVIRKDELSRFLYQCLNAANSNPDGYGFMSENAYMRCKDQMTKKDVIRILNEYKEKTRFFSVHLRYATCEKKTEFTHPFHYPYFIAMHNGVVTTENKISGSDSLDLFNALNERLYSVNGNCSNAAGISFYNALKGVIGGVSGSFSILAYVPKENALYYVRNTPDFNFMYIPTKNIVYGATKEERIKPLDFKRLGFFETALISKPKTNMVYKIDLSSGVFKRMGIVEEKPFSYQYGLSNFDNRDKQKKKHKFFKEKKGNDLFPGMYDNSEYYRKYYDSDYYGND